MASSSRTKSRGYGVPGFHENSLSMASAASSFASSTSSFSSRSSTFFARATSPLRVRVYGHSNQSSPSVRFSVDRPTSPGRSISVIKQCGSGGGGRPVSSQKKTCMCSPTTHPGSFRCSLHKGAGRAGNSHSTAYSSSRSLNFRRSAMTNSLVRICGVEGDLVKRALSALIRPSSHQLRRREDFRPRPSRLSVMSKAEDL
ncbi:uncharacterized protein LOC116194663 [Punica granatum]|uniref:Serine-rich protein-like protein n=2 Tax=Punica granatum TaxID=22663 RepID=A0A218XA80_PUNGR|nr:uncharacterized protein LOC116194663 [Punica granatum]OWM81857.1 hypothetical protein CDL15_Pgr007895 [Punica granatum]PKI48464.1 hypothetical protein CRG98_031086 [Punica granatum]